jgi:FtsP/CotA-like multicopper oxidase with cupredoxin domain
VIDSPHVDLPIVEAEVPVLPGPKTRMWTYGGDFPGPTIRRPTGETTTATFRHRLPRSAGELTTHLHGGHNTSRDDGQPGGLTASQPRSLYCDISPGLSARASGNDLLIAPGAARTYTYDFLEDGAPERGATHWYHDHRLDNTGRNVWRGLAGMWISHDGFDDSLPLPSGERDIPLVIADRSFTKRNQLTNPFGGIAHAPDDGVTGRYVLVNGAVLPHHRVRACRYRLRILNASNFRSYNLRLDGAAITQVGTESGLMPRPLRRRTLLIGPGERVDVVVDFRGAKHRDLVLRSVGRHDGPKRLGSKPWVGPLMQFRVGRAAVDRTEVPPALRPLPSWVAGAPTTPQKEWRMTVGSGFSPSWLINGRTFDPGYVEHRAELGTVETWKLVNATRVAHLFHIHLTDWYLLSRNGKPPAPAEACMKETFFMDPGEELLVAGRFSDHAGKFVVHCHMLDHEDHGLMSQFETYV